jgi:hypothetical protein
MITMTNDDLNDICRDPQSHFLLPGLRGRLLYNIERKEELEEERDPLCASPLEWTAIIHVVFAQLHVWQETSAPYTTFHSGHLHRGKARQYTMMQDFHDEKSARFRTPTSHRHATGVNHGLPSSFLLT